MGEIIGWLAEIGEFVGQLVAKIYKCITFSVSGPFGCKKRLDMGF